jgi:N-acetylglucosaminyldiphosphoundecaprenol N-acetyl-beta-D-mannosaminyltransferase
MMDSKKYSLFGVNFSATDYEEASTILVENAMHNTSYTFSALAVHGLVEAHKNPEVMNAVNSIDMVVPDGQPVRWALNSFYQLDLKDRVYGPDLTLHVLRKANCEKLKIYLYGSTPETLGKLTRFINRTYPDLTVCGIHSDRFREATQEEDAADIEKINTSGAHIVLVGRGCPRQELWVNAHKGKIMASMMAVGAAFDFHAEVVKQAPSWMQKNGLEWLYRLNQEPARLWKRYLFTNSTFIYLFLKKKIFT